MQEVHATRVVLESVKLDLQLELDPVWYTDTVILYTHVHRDAAMMITTLTVPVITFSTTYRCKYLRVEAAFAFYDFPWIVKHSNRKRS